MIRMVTTFTPLNPKTLLNHIQMSIPYLTDRITGIWYIRSIKRAAKNAPMISCLKLTRVARYEPCV